MTAVPARRSTPAVWLALLGLPLALLIAVAAPRSTLAADAGTLAFLQSRDGGFSRQLVLADSSGANQRVVTATRAEFQPSFSPGGDQIAFASPLGDDSLGRYGLFAVNTDGSGLRQLTAPQYGDADPAWSPDGGRIAFTRFDTGRLGADCCSVYVMAADGSGARVVPGTFRGTRPSWSPDGSRLVYDAPDGLHTVGVDGAGNTRIGGPGLHEPSWSPDGRTVAASLRQTSDESRLALIPAGGGEPVVAGSTRGQLEDPVWSADGSTIFAVVAQGQGVSGRTSSAVWRFSADGSGAAQLFAATPPVQHLAVAQPGPVPTGNLERADIRPGAVRVSGWALDPDTPDPIQVRITVDGGPVATVTADGSRPDVARVFPGTGQLHGFDTVVGLPTGMHRVCAVGVNVGKGADAIVGCRDVRLADTPIGNLDGTRRVPAGVAVGGWALDPRQTDPIPVHIYADGRIVTGVLADAQRRDVGAAFPGYGDNHGYAVPIPLSAGRHEVCAFGINPQGGTNPLLACRQVVVDGTPDGALDEAAVVDGQLRVRGWALDPDTAGPIPVHVYIDSNAPTGVLAQQPRTDIAAAYPGYGPEHGFVATLPVGPGRHRVCVYAINEGVGVSPLLRCATVGVAVG